MPLPAHPIHLGSLAAIGLMVVLAIAATASPWTTGTADFGSAEAKLTMTLWGYTYETPSSSQDSSFADTMDNDSPYCTNSATPTEKDVLGKYKAAQAGAILSILAAIGFGGVGAVYALGKFRMKILLAIPAGITGAFAMMCYGGYTSAYNTCSYSTCESLVNLWMAQGAQSASCGPAAGVFLVWVAVVCGIGAFVGFMIGTPPGLAPPPGVGEANMAVAQPMVAGQPINSAPYQAYPAAGVAAQPQVYAQPQQHQQQMVYAQPAYGQHPAYGQPQQQQHHADL